MRASYSALAALPLLVTGCAAHETRAAMAPEKSASVAPASAHEGNTTTSITVTYREAANVFEIMDNVSSWLPGKCDEEYRADWKTRFGVSADDERRFASYAVLRERSYPRPPDRNDVNTASLFGPAKPIDRFAAAFYDSSSLDEAFGKLDGIATPAEIAELRSFYAEYRPRYQSLLDESRAYSAIAPATQTRLDDAHADAYAVGLAKFYGVTNLPKFTALYVWWPPVENVTANSRDRFLLLKYNPAKHARAASSNIDIPIHEFVHYVSSHQSEEQKRALTQTFLAGCDPTKDVKPVKILEEPLAVAQQKLFLSTAGGGGFDANVPWYGGDRWVDPFAKALYPQLKEARASGRTIDDALMASAAKSCAELYATRSR